MKLDNIIYDVESLQNAIAQQWAADSEIFASIYPSDTSTALINGLAAYGSMLQYCLVSALANCYTTTAFSESAIYQLADTLGNDLHGNVSSQVIVNITKNNLVGINTTIPAYSTFDINGKKFFNPYGIIIPATTNYVHDITLIQGEIIEVNKTTSGIANEKFYFSSNFKASPNYISAYVNGEEWSIVDSFLGYDKGYVLDADDMNAVLLKTDPDGRAYVKVGDGQLATLPTTESILQIKYCSNDGADGNINETGITGTLSSQLMFVDNDGNENILDVDVVTTTTAYGGFSKQSIETLRYTSPYVFASGHRAIRRQDYNSILQNKCGYLTSAVWGEYEQADKVGAYDSIMMNMVYYTGVKTFENYPYTKIDVLTNPSSYTGALYSNSGFYGSYALRLSNLLGSSDKIYIQDTSGQGLLFINDNSQDPRDSILPDWIASTNQYYGNILGDIVTGGTQYKVNDELYLTTQFYCWQNGTNKIYTTSSTPAVGNRVYSITSSVSSYLGTITSITGSVTTIVYNNVTYSRYSAGDTIATTEIIVRITEINVSGVVSKVELITRTTQNDYNLSTLTNCSSVYYKKASKQSNGTGFVIKAKQYKFSSSSLVTTNDLDEDDTATHNTPIINARSDNTTDTYYKSINSPSLQNPVQVRLRYQNGNQAIAGIKFKATNPHSDSDLEGCPFIGTLAMFGTTLDVGDEGFSYENIRNSDSWDCIINHKELTTPWGDTTNNNWTDWIATNCFTGTVDTSGNPVFNTYKNFVIEFYSAQDIGVTNPKISFKSIKVLYGEDASEILYSSNGEIRLNLPSAGSPGPNTENTMGYLTTGLINSGIFQMYNYDVVLAGITEANGYKDGDILCYVFTGVNDKKILFSIQVASVANAQYIITIKDMNDSTSTESTILINTEYISMSSPAPLSTNILYTYKLNPENNIPVSGYAGSGYEVNDIITILDNDGNATDLTMRVANVNSSHEVLALTWLNNKSLITPPDTSSSYQYSNTSGGTGTGLKVVLVSTPATTGSGATIAITSNNNIEIDASFTGNRIDTDSVNYYDEPIIKEYNHFTTYLEFVQPEIVTQDISVQVAINKTATVSSGIVLQNVRNNILKLFEITPDYVGKGLKLSDIYKAVTDTDNVSWCKILNPTDNVAVNVNSILISSDITIEETLTDY